MRAIVVSEVGPDAEPYLAELPEPQPARDEVLIRVEFASVNPADRKCQRGWLTQFDGFNPAFPFVLGFDGVGTVVACGSDVATSLAGQRVFLRINQAAGRPGSFAEFTCARAADVAVVPDGLDPRAAATVPIAGVTAWQAIRRAAIGAGELVLINGGSGGVGSFAVQFARARGARVVATASAHNADYVLSLGCELALDYRHDDTAARVLEWAPDGIDLVLDTVNIAPLHGITDLVRSGGRVVGIETLGTLPLYDTASLTTAGISVETVSAERAAASADLEEIAALMAAGVVHAPQIEVLPLNLAPEALERVGSGHVRGKLLLAIG